MSRPVITLCLLSLLLCSVGCRMCNTPYDYCLSTSINRCNDYRGFNPMYRAGSIFGSHGCCTYQTVYEDAYYVSDTGDFVNNAGSYGNHSPVSLMRRNADNFEPRPQREPIAIPTFEPGAGGMMEPTRKNSDTGLPSVQELLDRPRGTTSNSIPLVPPVRQKVAPPSHKDASPSTIPFSPSDEEIVPQDPFPRTTDTDPPITLEELRRLDPSVRDLQIISIEDAAVESATR